MEALTGTEKQIVYGEKIRAQYLPAMEAYKATLSSQANLVPEEHKAAFNQCLSMIDEMMAQNDASWWLDNIKDTDFESFFVEFIMNPLVMGKNFRPVKEWHGHFSMTY